MAFVLEPTVIHLKGRAQEVERLVEHYMNNRLSNKTTSLASSSGFGPEPSQPTQGRHTQRQNLEFLTSSSVLHSVENQGTVTRLALISTFLIKEWNSLRAANFHL